MRKYVSRATKWLAIITLLCIVILVAGVVLNVIGSSDIGLQILLIGLGGFLTILFAGCFFAEKSRALIIDADKIIFPRGAQKNGKIVFRKTVVHFEEIECVESRLYKGDKIVSKDCFFHTLKLKDGTVITVTLYSYGEEQENEILKVIRSSIK